MRVLFTTLPGAGNFHPLVPLAHTLRAAGHEVAFACARSYGPTVEATGFGCFPAGFDWMLSEREPVYARVQAEVARRPIPFSPLADVYARFLPAQMLPDLLSLIRAWSPDVLVRDPMEFAGCIAAECLDTPHAACGPLFVFWQGAWHDTPGEVPKPELDPLRCAHGLPPDPGLAMLYRHLSLAFLPPAFVGPDLAIPSTGQFIRPISFNQSGDEGLPAWVTQLPERPTVHASLGTIFHRTPGVFTVILDGLRDEPINLILAVGRDQDPAQFGPQPSNIFIERYIPHTVLLPYCDVVITHGGFSSVMACFNQGMPMVLMPLAGGDQRGNARRCAALGAGQIIAPDQRTPERIREAVLEVRGNRRYRARAEQVQTRCSSCRGRSMPSPCWSNSRLGRGVTEDDHRGSRGSPKGHMHASSLPSHTAGRALIAQAAAMSRLRAHHVSLQELIASPGSIMWASKGTSLQAGRSISASRNS